MPNPLLGIPVATGNGAPVQPTPAARVNPLLGIRPVLPPARPLTADLADAVRRGVRSVGTVGLAPLAAGEQLSLAIAQALGAEVDPSLAPVSQTLRDNAVTDQAAAQLRAAEFAPASMAREAAVSAVESGLPLVATLPLGAAPAVARAGATRAAATLAAPGAAVTMGQSIGTDAADGRYSPAEILARAGVQGGLELGGELVPIGRFRGGEADLARVLGEIVGGGRAGQVTRVAAEAVPEIGAQAIQEAATGGAQSLADSATSADQIGVQEALARAGDDAVQSALAGALLGAGVQVPRVAAAALRGEPSAAAQRAIAEYQALQQAAAPEPGASDGQFSRVPDQSPDRSGSGVEPVGADPGPVGDVGAGAAAAPVDAAPLRGPTTGGYAEAQPVDAATVDATLQQGADAAAEERGSEQLAAEERRRAEAERLALARLPALREDLQGLVDLNLPGAQERLDAVAGEASPATVIEALRFVRQAIGERKPAQFVPIGRQPADPTPAAAVAPVAPAAPAPGTPIQEAPREPVQQSVIQPAPAARPVQADQAGAPSRGADAANVPPMDLGPGQVSAAAAPAPDPAARPAVAGSNPFAQAAAESFRPGMAVEARLPRGKAFVGTVEAITGDRVAVRGQKTGVIREFPALKLTPVRAAAPALQQAVTPPAKLTYEPQAGLAKPQRAAETRLAGILSATETADQAYDALPETSGGRVLNVDAVRELSPDYQQDRPGFAQAVHEPASAYIKQRFARMLARPDLPGRPIVRFLAGGGGSGKSTVQERLDRGVDPEQQPQITMDATLGRYESAAKLVRQALAAGKQAQIEYVHRPFAQAVAGVVNRARPRNGQAQRTVRLADLAEAHAGAQATILRLEREFSGDPRVSIRVWDNSGGQVRPGMAIADIAKTRYAGDENKRGEALAALEQQGREAIVREHQRTPVPDQILRAIDPVGFRAGAYRAVDDAGGVGSVAEGRGGAPAGRGGGAESALRGRKSTTQAGRKRPPRAPAPDAPGADRNPGSEAADAGRVAGAGSAATESRAAGAAGGGTGLVGESTDIEIPGAAPVAARYAVRELADLKPSHTYQDGAPVPTPGYPAALQPRDYRLGNDEDQKVKRQAGAFKPSYLISDHPDATSGPSVVTQDGTVINGNSRVMTLQAITPEQMAGYRTLLEKKAAGFGIDPAAVRGLRQPVLVRVVDLAPTSPEALRFARQGNVSATQAQSPVRTAASLGGLINQETIDALDLGEDATFSDAVAGPSGREFRRQVLEALPPTVRGQFFDEGTGQLTDMGKTLVRDILLTKALPVEVIERLHDDRAGLLRTIEGSVPQLLRMQGMTGGRELHAALTEALSWMATHPTVTKEGDVAALLDANGTQIQQGIFADQGEALSPEARMVLSYVLREQSRPRRFKEGLVAAVGALDNKANSFLAESMGEPAQLVAEALGVSPAAGATFADAPTAADEAMPGPTPTLKPGQQAAPERALGGQLVRQPTRRGGRIPVAALERPTGQPGQPSAVPRLKAIIRQLREALITAGAGDPGLYEGEAPRGTGGIFDETTGMAAIARHGDLDAAAHEIGHRIAWRFKLDEVEGQQGLPTELADFARFGSTPPSDLAADQRQAYRDKEGWAEFIRAAIVNPSEAERRAPAMLAVYRERIPEPIRDALQQYGDAARQFLGLDPEARTEANIQSISDLVAENKLHVAVAHWFNLPEALAAARRDPRAYGKLIAFLRTVWTGMGTQAQDVQASSSQATPERLKELRRKLPMWRKFRYLWQNVWWPAYARYAEGYARRGIDVDSLLPEQNFRILNRLQAGNDGRALEQTFGTGLVDGRGRPVVDNETGERLNWAWLMQPVENEHPHKTLRLVDKALAWAVEQRTAAEGDKRMAQGQKDIDAFVADLEAAARGEEGIETINRLVQAYQELTQDAANAAALRVEVQSLAKSKRKPELRRLNRWTEAYAEARRKQAAESAARITGIGGGLVSDTVQAQAALARREQARDPDQPAMAEFLRRYRLWANHLVRVLAEKGVFTAEAATAMQDAGKWTNLETGETLDVYVDLHRIFDGEETSARVGGRFQGSTRMIANPLRNLIEATLNTIARGERNQAMNALTDAFRGSEGERVDLHDLGREVPDTVVQEARKDGGTGLINGRKPYRILREGVPEWWVFDPQIELSLESARAPGGSDLLTRIWGLLTRVMRAAITTAPAFMVRNIIRDIQNRLIVSETATGSGIKSVFESFGSLDTADGVRQARELSRLAGGSYAGYIDGKSVLGAELARHLDRLAADGWQGKAVRVLSPRSWLALAEKVGETAESINRNAEYVTAFRDAKQRGLDDYNASLFAADKSRGLIDFAEAGLWGRQLTRVVLFFNPAVQGMARFARTWQLVAKHAAAGKTVPEKLQRLVTARATVALGLMTAAGVMLRLLLSDDEEEAWRQQPASVRDFHWMIPMPEGLPYLAVPKEYSWGFFMSGAERLTDAVMALRQGKPEEARRAFEGYAGSAAGALLPLNDVSSLMGGFGPIIEAANNFDQFRQRSIIPTWEVGKDLSLRDTSRASPLAKKLQGLLNADARMIDHIGHGYGGWIYGMVSERTVTRNVDKSDQRKDVAEIVGSLSGLGKPQPSGQARDVEWVRDYAGRFGREQSAWNKALSARLRQAYEAQDPATREAKAAEARRFASDLRARIERNPEVFKRAPKAPE